MGFETNNVIEKVRAVYVDKDGDPEIKEYSSSKELYDDVSNESISLHQIDGNMYVIYGTHAEKDGERCTYQFTVGTGEEMVTKKFYGNVVIAALDFDLGGFLDLTEEQLDALFDDSSDKNCGQTPIKAVYSKLGACPEVVTLSSEEDIFYLLGSDNLMLTKVGEKIYAVSRSEAKLNGEEKNLENWVFDGNRFVKEYIYGDVLILRYIPDIGRVYDFTDEQVLGILSMFEDV